MSRWEKNYGWVDDYRTAVSVHPTTHDLQGSLKTFYSVFT